MLPEPVVLGEHRFMLSEIEGVWKVSEYDSSSDALINEMIPVNRKLELITLKDAEEAYSQALSISRRETIDTLKHYYETCFVIFSKQDIPDNERWL